MPDDSQAASLTVLAGPLKGTRLVLEDAVDDILVGSDPDCRLSLDLPGVSPIHARLWLDLEGAVVHDTRSPHGVWINDERVVGQAPLRDGDVLWLGEPGGAESVMIQFRHPEARAAAEAAAGEAASDHDREAVAAPPGGYWPLEEALPPEEEEEEEETPSSSAAVDMQDPLLQLLEEREAEPSAVTARPPAEPEPPPIPQRRPAGREPPPIPARPPAAAEPPAAVPVAPPPAPAPSPGPQTAWFELEPEAPPEPIESQPAALAEQPPAEAAPFADFDVLSDPAATATPPEPPPVPAAPAAEEFFVDEPGRGGQEVEFLLDEPPETSAPAAPAAAPEPPAAEAPSWSDLAVALEGPEAMETPTMALHMDEPPPIPEPSLKPSVAAPPPIPEPSPKLSVAVPPPIPAPSPKPSAVAPPPVSQDDVFEAPPEAPAPPAPPPHPVAAARPAPPPAAATEPPRRAAPAHRPEPAIPFPSRAEAVARPRPAPPRSRRGLFIAAGLVALLALAGGAFVMLAPLREPRLASVQPGRARAGEVVTLMGENFASEPARNLVRFEGGRQGRVVEVAPDRIRVEVPEIPTPPGRQNLVPVVVEVEGRRSNPVELAVYQAPRVHGVSPSVAMPGEEIVLAGSGWGPGATVKFGALEAEVLDVTPTSIKVRVPALEGRPGTSAPVVVWLGSESSNAAPFLLGRLPLVMAVQPDNGRPGDLITVVGRGFRPEPAANDVRIGGVKALVVAAADGELAAVVPWQTADGQTPVEVRVPGSEDVGRATLTLAPAAEAVELRFVAEPMPVPDAEGHDHVALATPLGPTFIVSASGGRTAAARAWEAQRRLNEAAGPLRANLEADIEVRDLATNPYLALAGRPEPLLEVAAEDAAAYEEPWAGPRGRGGPVTRARLAVWWGAVVRDLVLLLIRGERPQHAAALAPEGRVLGELFLASRRAGRFGITRDLLARPRTGLREGLRLLALRLPASVVAPTGAPDAGEAAPAPQPTPTAAAPAATLEGEWQGHEADEGDRRLMTVVFTRGGGTLSYQRALTMSLPLLGFEHGRRGALRYHLQTARGIRYYIGTWDGSSKITGIISSDPSGKPQIGTFELERSR